MSGKAVPVASAGSKKAGVSETWTPQVMVPSAAEDGAGTPHVARTSTIAAAAHRGEMDIMRVLFIARGPREALPPCALLRGMPRMTRAGSSRVGIDAVFLELLAERVAVDAEELGGAHLIALGLAHDGAEEGLLDQPHHEAVQVGRGVAAEPADALDHLLLDDLFQRGVRLHPRGRRDGPDGEMLGHDHAARGHDHGALDHVLELADIAGPLVARQASHGLGRDHPLAQRLGVLREEMLDEEGDVAPP